MGKRRPEFKRRSVDSGPDCPFNLLLALTSQKAWNQKIKWEPHSGGIAPHDPGNGGECKEEAKTNGGERKGKTTRIDNFAKEYTKEKNTKKKQ